MKTMKVALLATAALAAVTVSARADDASAIKAQLEALNARIAQLEAAPAVPVGYSLLTIGDGVASTIPGLQDSGKDIAAYGPKATVIGIMPTADMPASTTIEWSGYVRAILRYDGYQDPAKNDAANITARGQLKVVGKTDTAVGEVGAKIQIRGNFSGLGDAGGSTQPGGLKMNEAFGYWAMTPELTLGGGYTGTLAAIGYGVDGSCNCYGTDNASAAYTNPGDDTQMRLTYASGPLSMAISLNDISDNGENSAFAGSNGALGVQGEIKYTGDMISGEISTAFHDSSSNFVGAKDAWAIGAGAGIALGDMANLSMSTQFAKINNGQKRAHFSALLSADLSDSVHGEVGASYENYSSGANPDQTAVLAGLYYDPVSQLTIGLEAEYINPKGKKNNVSTVDLVTVFRF